MKNFFENKTEIEFDNFLFQELQKNDVETPVEEKKDDEPDLDDKIEANIAADAPKVLEATKTSETQRYTKGFLGAEGHVDLAIDTTAKDVAKAKKEGLEATKKNMEKAVEIEADVAVETAELQNWYNGATTEIRGSYAAADGNLDNAEKQNTQETTDGIMDILGGIA